MAVQERYNQRVADALDESYKAAGEMEGVEPLDVNKARWIIFSDHHKGGRNGADDFLVCERAYNAALAYYYRMGYTLVALGDVEELWEERPRNVLKTYRHTLDLEARFHKDGRYLRFWGNHDDIWRYDAEVKKHLQPIFGDERPLAVLDGLLVPVKDGDKELGMLFLVHGHQGTLDSDQFKTISQFFVRQIWRPIQRTIKRSFNTPAKDWQLRQTHNIALYKWSEDKGKLVMIAGHTHRPVFMSLTHEAQLQAEIDAMRNDLEADQNNNQLKEKLSYGEAELEWVKAQQRQRPGDAEADKQVRPSYFNTGCCSFLDGDVTGLEIVGGKIRLVRWPDEDSQPRRDILAEASLDNVFGQL